MRKNIFSLLLFSLLSISAFANNGNTAPVFGDSAIPGGFSESGALSFGMAYSIPNALSREELMRVYNLLECLHCDKCIEEEEDPTEG